MSSSGSLTKNERLDLQKEWTDLWRHMQEPYLAFQTQLSLMNRIQIQKDQLKEQWIYQHCVRNIDKIARMGEIYRVLDLKRYYEDGKD